MGESVHVIVLDTFVAVIAGVIMFCACFTYGLEVNAGPSLLFDTMATVFSHMPGGRWWGALFFLFMVFAAMSTVLGVCENILAMVRELTGWSRPKGCVVCAAGIFVLALTTALGYSVIKFQPFAEQHGLIYGILLYLTISFRLDRLYLHCFAATSLDGAGISSWKRLIQERALR